MSRTSQLALVALVVLSFALSAGLIFTATQWLRAPLAAAATLSRVARHAAHAAPAPACDTALRLEVAGDGSNGFAYSTDDSGDGDNYAFLDGGHDNVIMNGNGHWPDADELLRDDHRPVLWFVRDGREWITRDRSITDEAREALRPLREIGREMGRVGGRMGEIGGRQGRIGGEMGRLGGRLAELSVRRATSDLDGSERERVDREIAAIHAEMKLLGTRMSDASSHGESESLREQMRALSARHKAEQRRVRERMHTLIERAVRERLAERLAIGA